jgi:hypothetical protein
MIAASAAPRDESNASIPDGESIEAWTAAAVLEQARDIASALDPAQSTLYRTMPPTRWAQAVTLGSMLLTASTAYRLHNPRGRGRRQHAAELHAALDATNSANLVAAVALMLVVGRVVDQSPRP